MRGLLRGIITSVLGSKGWVVEKYFEKLDAVGSTVRYEAMKLYTGSV